MARRIPADPSAPSAPGWLAEGYGHIWLPYTQMATVSPPLPVAATRGSRIVLADGRELIDGIASWWTACHGYNHPHIRAAVAEQLDRMPHVMFGGLANEPALRLARRLAGMLPDPLNRVFFSESGSVAVEIALKMALQYWLNQGVRGRHRFVSFQGAYHGDTFAAMSVCDPEEGMHSLFAGALPKQHVVPLPEDEAGMAAFDTYLARHGEDVAAVIVEPLVQGAGGMRFHVPETLRALRAACDKHDLLFIADEIMTGFGRTGTLFACEQAQVVPDIVTLSKALTGGTMALAATVASDRVFEAFLSDDADAALMHGPTFMANPLAAAVSLASIKLLLSRDWRGEVQQIESELTEGLAPASSLPGVREVRVLGAIGVVEMEAPIPVATTQAALIERGVWLRPFGRLLYTMPPFVSSVPDIRTIAAAMVDAAGRQ